jgi:hypothetical protein
MKRRKGKKLPRFIDSRLKEFNFPEYGVTVQAKNWPEAKEKVFEIIRKK